MLLALDTSSRWMGAAVYDGERVYSELLWYSPDFHTAHLATLVDEAVNRGGAVWGDIMTIAVATGPGGFTGLRVGLALAKGLVLARKLRLIGIPSLDGLMAAQLSAVSEDGIWPYSIGAGLLQAGRGRLAVGWYEPGDNPQVLSKEVPAQAVGLAPALHGKGYEILSPEALAERAVYLAREQGPVLLCGEMNNYERQVIVEKVKDLPVTLASAAQSTRRPSFLAELAWKRWQADDFDDPATLVPIYLH